jgi:hypothetical protein
VSPPLVYLSVTDSLWIHVDQNLMGVVKYLLLCECAVPKCLHLLYLRVADGLRVQVYQGLAQLLQFVCQLRFDLNSGFFTVNFFKPPRFITRDSTDIIISACQPAPVI